MALPANTIFRDFVTDGVASSGEHEPIKWQIRELLGQFENVIAAGMLADAVWKATKALLVTDLAHSAGTSGIVYNDSAAANNGIYVKSGGSGSGSWSQVLTFLPGYQFVKASNMGAGSANAIQATSSPKVAYTDGVQLIRLNIFETNTSGTITVSFDGGAALTIQTASGNSPAIGGLAAGMQVLGVVDQSATVFRLLSDQASSAIQTAAENAHSYAEEWANKAEDSLVSVAAGGDLVDDYSAMHFARKTAADRAVTVAAKSAAVAAAEASGDILFYDTYSDADTALAGLSENQVVEVFADETRGGLPSRYRVESASLVFKLDLGQFDRLMELDLRKPRKLWAKLREMAANNAGQLHWCSAGDSLASRKFAQFAHNLERMIGGFNYADGNFPGNNPATQAGDQLFTTDHVNVTEVAADYGIVPTGVYQNITDGGSLRFTLGGYDPAYTKIRVFYIKESGAGTIDLLVNGSVEDTADADQMTTELGILEHSTGATTVDPGPTTISVSGGAVKVLGGHILREDKRGLVKYTLLSAGGITPVQMTQNATVKLVHQQLLQAMNPDIITLEMDDTFGDGGVNQDALDDIMDVWLAAVPYADKLLIGSTPRASNDTGKMLANLRLREVAQARGRSCLYFDSYKLMGSYTDMTAIFGADDGVHPNVRAQQFAAEMLWDYLGLNNHNLGFHNRAVRSPNVASSLYHGTELRAGVSRLVFNSDNTFGYNWDIVYNRALRLKSEAGVVVAQFSHNTGLEPNILPSNFTWNAAGGPYTVSILETANHNSIFFADSGNDSGRMNVRVGFISVGSFTKAELNAMSPNAMAGWMCFCPDANGGPGLVVSNGGAGASGWKRVDDNSVSATT